MVRVHTPAGVDKQVLAERIKKARLETSLSQTELGEAIGLSDKSISAYEKGRAVPPIDKLKKIAQETHRPVQYFTGETEKDFTVEAKLAAIEEELRGIRDLLKESADSGL